MKKGKGSEMDFFCYEVFAKQKNKKSFMIH
jgi:hypothetical protein